ncbi:MAG: MDR/zinc-dependent alcohol dehydrogenase-like family protein [Solirubrobacterales bacterium]
MTRVSPATAGALHTISAKRTMAAAIIAGPQRMEIRSVPVPEPAGGQVRVRLEGCGVCASNLPVWQGRPYFRYPFEPGAPGHEAWGRIDAIGSNVTDFHPGDRVALLSYHAYAEYDVASREDVVLLPEELAGQPFPAEPLACAVNAFRRAGVAAGSTVALVGIGFLGSLLACLAVKAGARVIAISRRPFALHVARRCGAAHAIEMHDHYAVVEQVKRLTDDRGCEIVIEAVGAQWPLDLATDLTAVRGRLVIAGYHQDGLRQVNLQSWNWKGLDVINAHERDPRVYTAGMEEAVRMAAAGVFPTRDLLTHAYSLEELPLAMRDMETRPEGFLKGWIRYD